MNIDVTATDGDRTWSEKFTDVIEVNVNEDMHPGALYVSVDHGKSAGVKKFRGDTYITVEKQPRIEAVFAPGAWHSWRRTD